MFVLETLQTDGIAQLSYLVGDTETGHAAVIDPRTDVEVYPELARKHGLSITHLFETHIHADFVSGAALAGGPFGAGRGLPQRRVVGLRVPLQQDQGRRPVWFRRVHPDRPAHTRPHAGASFL